MVERGTNVVRFYEYWKPDKSQTEAQGFEVGEKIDYIEIHGAGSKLSVFHRKVTEQDKIVYGHEWDLYQRGLEQVAEGTPLAVWPVLTGGVIANLKSHNIHTIEALAACSDAALQNIGPGTRQLQNAAKSFLEEAISGNANLPAENVDLQAENERLVAKIAELEAKVAGQAEKIERQAKKLDARKTRKAA